LTSGASPSRAVIWQARDLPAANSVRNANMARLGSKSPMIGAAMGLLAGYGQ
jgi:hypothetical protein